MNFPLGTPTWMIQRLKALAQHGKLHTVPPQILAAICYYTSHWGLTGLGVNPQGFGGYYGIHETWTYHGVLFTAAQLRTPNTFNTQTICAATTLALYRLPLARALAMYVSGNPTNTNDGFVAYVLHATGATPNYIFTVHKVTVKTIGDSMSTSVGTGVIAVDGVSKGHKILFTVPIADRADAHQWSIMDLTDAAAVQNVAGATQFTS